MEADALTPQEQSWLEDARALARRSLAPPRESAGALAVSTSGETFPGVAVQLTTTPGLSVCAEQVALCAARAAGADEISHLCLWIGPAAGDHPCGACRQVWLELAPRARWLLQRGDQPPQRLSLATLLPEPFEEFAPDA
jgi:cytidine deaminase